MLLNCDSHHLKIFVSCNYFILDLFFNVCNLQKKCYSVYIKNNNFSDYISINAIY